MEEPQTGDGSRLVGVAPRADPLVGARDVERDDAPDLGLPGSRARQSHRRGTPVAARVRRLALGRRRTLACDRRAARRRRLHGVRSKPLRPPRAARGGAPAARAGGEGGYRPLRQLELARSARARQAGRVLAAGRPHVVSPRALRQHRHHHSHGHPSRQPALRAGDPRAVGGSAVAGHRAPDDLADVRVLLQGDAGGARARVHERSAGTAADDQGDSRLRAGRLSPRAPPEAVRGPLQAARADVPVGDTRLDADGVRQRHDARARLFVRRHPGCGRYDRSRRGRARHRRLHLSGRHARNHLQHVRRRRSAHDVPRRLLLVPRHRAAGADSRCAPSGARLAHRRHPIRQRLLHVSRRHGAGGRRVEPPYRARGAHRARRRERSGEEHARQAAPSVLRSRSEAPFALAASISETSIRKPCGAGSACCSRITPATS